MADDGNGGTPASTTFDVVVNPVNDTPTVDTALTTVNATEDDTDSTIDASGVFADVEDASLTLTAVSSDDSLVTATISGQNLVLDYQPDASGTATITLTGTDSGGLAVSSTLTVNVAPANDNPVLAPVGDYSVDEGELLTFTASATDSDIPTDALTFSLSNGAGGFVPAGASINATTGVFTWTPTESQQGTRTFDVVVTDNGTGALTDSETITITINDVNTAPVLTTIGNQSVNEGSNLAFTATATDSDLPANALTFSLEGAPSNATIGSSSGAFSWTPTEAQGGGEYTFTVVVSDGTTTDSETITVSVAEVNSDPVLAAIGAQSVNEGSTLTFTAAASDSDIPVNNLTFSLADGAGGMVPAGATINPATGAFTWTTTEAMGGNTATFDVVVSDGISTDSETISVTINDVNIDPTVDGGLSDVEVAEDSAEVTVDVSSAFDDADGDSLTFSASSGNMGIVTVSTSGSDVTLSFVADASGTASITVMADDGNGGTPASTTFDVVVNAVNDGPTVATPLSDVDSTDLSPSLTLDASGVFGDIDDGAAAVSITAVSSDDNLVTVTTSGQTVTLDFQAEARGTATITMIGTDPQGASVTSTFNVNVTLEAAIQLPSGGGTYEVLRDGADVVVRVAGGSELFRETASLVASVNITGSGDADIVNVLDAGGAVDTPITFDGLDGDDRFDGTLAGSSVTASGGAGADTLMGGAFGDDLSGGDGDDRVFAKGGDDRIDGGAGNDRIFGNEGADVLDGGDGDDFARGGFDDDIIFGQDGRDEILGDQGNDRLFGGIGFDTISGGTGNDFIRGDFGNDRLSGDDGQDEILGDQGDDVLFGGMGDDLLNGGDGNDRHFGEKGADTMFGGAGNDDLFGDDGFDSISGGLGDDLVRGGRGNDRLFGDEGNDNIIGDSENDVLFGGADNDTLSGGDGQDRLFGEGGNDALDGGLGNDELFGGDGNDVVSGRGGADLIRGSNGDDILNGDDGDDTINGDGGDDTIQGGNDVDSIIGGDGSDRVDGNVGADTINVQRFPLSDGIDTVVFDMLDTIFADPDDLLI